MECRGDDVPDGKLTAFRRAVRAMDDESVMVLATRLAWCYGCRTLFAIGKRDA
ncbi:DUF1428 family protein [Rhodanobacter terrae]|uniref:DUF1428 family protein n=1 Tax=Rhodanobacter terrae TaxID=418647 RepID=A0ABW0SV19_9GAMM